MFITGRPSRNAELQPAWPGRITPALLDIRACQLLPDEANRGFRKVLFYLGLR